MIKTNRLKFVFVIIGLVLTQSLLAQTAPIPRDQIKQELIRSGVDESELKERLLAKGINLDVMSPQELLDSKSKIEATIAEIKNQQDSSAQEQEAHEAATGVLPESIDVTEDVRDAVENGASVEEARAEAEIDLINNESNVQASGIYGHELFRNKTLKVYRASENAKAPDTYVLDTGDELAISIFGASQTDLLFEIGKDGFIKPTGIPRIYLRGRTLEEARELVRSRMSNYYVFSEGQFSMSIDAARTISVSIYGEVKQSGTYNLSALNGALNALLAAGGPTSEGSVRNIELIRGGKSSRIDIYEFLQNPGKSASVSLRDKDIINVPLAQELVVISGGVRRPMTYELTERESLGALVEYAGGTTPKAALSASRLERYEDGVTKVIDLNPTTFNQFYPKNGDVIEIPIVQNPIQDFVSIKGEVLIGGKFGFRQDLTLGDVLKRAQLKPSARKDVAFIQRVNDDGSRKLVRVNLVESSEDYQKVLKRGDQISILAASKFVDNAQFTVRGAVRDSEQTHPYPQDGKLTLEEAILLSSGVEENATSEALVIRTPQENREERKYLRIPLTEANSFIIQPFDEIILYNHERFSDSPLVKIAGAVRQPMEVRWDSTLSINDLIHIAGGIRFDASRDRVEVYRLNLDGNKTLILHETIELNDNGEAISNDFELKPFDEVFVRSSKGFKPIELIEIAGEINFPGTYGRLNGKNRVSDLIERAGGLTDDAFAAGATLVQQTKAGQHIVLGLDEILTNPLSPNNIVLRPGDKIVIPRPLETVTIYTANTHARRFGTDSLTNRGKIIVAYQGDHSASWYVNKYAGGFTNNAEKKATTVTGADGAIEETKSILGIKLYPKTEPGSIIYTTTKAPKKEKPRRERTSWSEIAQVVIAAMTTIATLIIISNNNNP